MPAVADPIRGIFKLLCLALVPLFAACGGGGGDGGGGGGGGALASACSGTATEPTPAAPAPGAPPAGITLSLTPVGSGFVAPVLATAPSDETQFLWVVEKGGLIKVVRLSTNTVINTFLDVSGLVSTSGERGLLGLAFDPGYRTNRRFYISYTNNNGNGDVVIARYLVDPGNATEAVPTADGIIMTIPNPGENLFGGMIAFGPNDGMLYISRGHGGDNGSTDGDPNNLAQNLGSLLGKLLRINVNADDFPADANTNYGVPPDNPCVGQAGARGEIWSIGLRNPWRFSFDSANGNLYVGDVGHQSREEINVSTVASGAGRGKNFGWRVMEGKACFNPASGCSPGNITQPVVDYTSTGADCSVVGGYVYNGSALAALGLQGTYFYGDFCSGAVRSFRYNGQVEQHTQWTIPSPGMITSFGEDGAGELYITTIEGGVFRITP